MLCVVAARGHNSRVMPLWAEEIIVMRQGQIPRADITVTLLLHYEPLPEKDVASTDAEREITLIHAGNISLPDDAVATITDKESWINYITKSGVGHSYRIVSSGEVEIGVGMLEPMISMQTFEKPAKAIPCSMKWKRWPQDYSDTEFERLTGQSKPKSVFQQPIFTFVQAVAQFPEPAPPGIYICRVQFYTEEGMTRGNDDNVLYPAFGPDIVKENLRNKIRELLADGDPDKVGHQYAALFRDTVCELPVAKYELALVGGNPDRTYTLAAGAELCLAGMDYLPAPIPHIRDGGAPFWYLQPKNLRFRAKVRSSPRSLSGPDEEQLWDSLEKSSALLESELASITEKVNSTLKRIEALEKGSTHA